VDAQIVVVIPKALVASEAIASVTQECHIGAHGPLAIGLDWCQSTTMAARPGSMRPLYVRATIVNVVGEANSTMAVHLKTRQPVTS